MAGPVIQGIDTLASAMKGNIIPDQEYLLQGSLLDSHIEVFKHRLRGLCDNTLGGEEQFCEREMVFSTKKSQNWEGRRFLGLCSRDEGNPSHYQIDPPGVSGLPNPLRGTRTRLRKGTF